MDRTIENRWNSYAAERSPETRRALASGYINLVRYVVGKLGIPEPVGSVLREHDLVQFGMIGLMTAIDRFDPARGVRFETYAIPRIRGTILDELRKLDPGFRGRGKRGGDAGVGQTSFRDPEFRFRRPAGEEDLAPSRAVEDLVRDDTPGPEERMVLAEQTRTLAHALARLGERDRLVVTLHYYEGLPQKDIAAVLHLSESRVSQIHTAVMNSLRQTLAGAGFTAPVHGE